MSPTTTGSRNEARSESRTAGWRIAAPHPRLLRAGGGGMGRGLGQLPLRSGPAGVLRRRTAAQHGRRVRHGALSGDQPAEQWAARGPDEPLALSTQRRAHRTHRLVAAAHRPTRPPHLRRRHRALDWIRPVRPGRPSAHVPVVVLGRHYSVLLAIQEHHDLVTGGPYRWVRHPFYLGSVVNAVGWALVFRSSLGLLLAAAVVLAEDPCMLLKEVREIRVREFI